MPATFAPELKRNMELYDSGYGSLEPETPRIPISRRIPKRGSRIGTERVGNDGYWVTPDRLFGKEKTIGNDGCWVNPGRVFGALPNGEEGEGFFDRWRDYRKMVREQYPFVQWRKFHNVWKMPVNYLFSKLFGHISENIIPEDSRTTIPATLLGGLSDTFYLTTRETFKGLAADIFPRIRVLSAFSDSATDIETLYTYRMTSGEELPVYLQRRKEPKPENNICTRNAEFIQRHGISPYNKVRKLAQKMMNPEFIKYAVDKLTRGDFTKYFEEEPAKARRWLMKDDTDLIVQYGEMDSGLGQNYTQLIQNTGLPGEVRVYKEPVYESGFWYNVGKLFGDESPSSWRAMWKWQLQDWGYDGIDLGFGPAEALLHKIRMNKTGIRRILDAEYKISATVGRQLQRGREVNFMYELPGKRLYQIRAAAQEADANFGYN